MFIICIIISIVVIVMIVIIIVICTARIATTLMESGPLHATTGEALPMKSSMRRPQWARRPPAGASLHLFLSSAKNNN